MEGLRFRAYLLDAAVFGFIGGWIAGMFLGLWAYATLFAHDFSREILLMMCCVFLVCVPLLLLYRKRKARDGAETLSWGDKLLYFLLGSALCWLISGYLVK